MSFNDLNKVPQKSRPGNESGKGDDEENLICQLENSKTKINRADYEAVKEVIDIMHTECNKIRRSSRLKIAKRIIDGISDEQNGYRIKGLFLEYYPNTTLPESIFGLDALESLILFDSSFLKNLSPAIGRLKNLKILKIVNAIALRTLPAAIGHLEKLEVLILDDGVLEALPTTIGHLINLEVLSIDGASALKALPTTIGRLKNLKIFSFREAGSLNILPDNICYLPNLQSLTITDSKITSLPNGFTNLQSLVEVNLSSIYDFEEEIISTLNGLKKLKELDLRLGCSVWRQNGLPELIGNLRSLVRLEVRSQDIIQLPDIFENLNNIHELAFYELPIRALPTSFGSLVNLVKLQLESIKHLKTLPENFGNLVNLQFLSMQSSGIEDIPGTVAVLKNLVKLDLSSSSVRTLPENFGNLINLEKLDLSGSCITELPQSFENLIKLKKLYLHYTEHWINVPTSFEKLENLQELNIQGYRIQMGLSIPFCVSLPKNLLRLKLTRTTDVFFFPDSLQELELFGPTNNAFCEIETSFPDLKRLQLATHPSRYLGSLDDSDLDRFCLEVLPRCPNLSELDISGNNITKISADSLDAFTHSKIRSIRLTSNPILRERETIKQRLLKLVKQCKLHGGVEYGYPPTIYYLMGLNKAERVLFSSQSIQNSIWPTILESPHVVFRGTAYMSEEDILFEILRRRLANDMHSWWPKK